ncbi:hypothetical protein ACS0PU_006860 [Formica fusca]|uniref:uncharacterized protein LOC115234199 n=1 Tax=Formica exsecta TaxID=72781 RepID=UPI001143E518|nr:uncharacterized protein LOC115234199 [Formica exsecta]
MKKIYLTIFLTICTCNVLLGSNKPQCFKFTWIPRGERDCTVYNEEYPNIPCKKPILNYTELNTTKLWNDIQNNENSDCLEPLESDCSVCIKYTYVYNRKIINASYFCGKVIEDQAIAVTSGCYVTYIEGFAVEACACQSEAGRMPCNSTIRNTYSILIIFMATLPFIYKIFNIP